MKIETILWSFLMVVAMILSGCTGSMQLAKKGDKLNDAGLYTEAAQFYYDALVRNNKNTKAQIGLTATAQYVVNDILAKFVTARMNRDDETAVYSYLTARSYYDKIQKLGISLSWPSHYEADFNESKERYLLQRYNRGADLMAERRYDEANEIFNEIIELEPHYKDANQLKGISRNEPIYIAGTALLENREYRRAYYEFENIYRNDPGYKDVSFLLKTCLEKGQYPVAILPFENATLYPNLEKAVQAVTLSALTSVSDPFLKVIDRRNMDVILREQQLNLNDHINPQTAGDVGNLLGAKAIITGTLLSYEPILGKPIITAKKGFEEIKTKYENEETGETVTETTYNQVRYNEHYVRNEVKVTFQYNFISLETGQIMRSQILEDRLISESHFATYPGEITLLYPSDNSGNVITSSAAKTNLLNLLRAPRNILSIDDLSSDLYFGFANHLTNDLLREIHK